MADIAPGVEAGYELAPVEPAPLEVVPASEPVELEPDIIDGDWRVIESPAPLTTMEPAPGEWWTTPGPAPQWQPEPEPMPSTALPDRRPAPNTSYPSHPSYPPSAAPAPAPTPWLLTLPQAAVREWVIPIFVPVITFFSLDWLWGGGNHSSGGGYRSGSHGGPHIRAAVDYLTYYTQSEHGGTVHYFLVNQRKINLASETYTDEGLYVFTVPLYHKGRMERAIDDLDAIGILVEEFN